jgi:hypothetical protein
MEVPTSHPPAISPASPECTTEFSGLTYIMRLLTGSLFLVRMSSASPTVVLPALFHPPFCPNVPLVPFLRPLVPPLRPLVPPLCPLVHPLCPLVHPLCPLVPPLCPPAFPLTPTVLLLPSLFPIRPALWRNPLAAASLGTARPKSALSQPVTPIDEASTTEFYFHSLINAIYHIPLCV